MKTLNAIGLSAAIALAGCDKPQQLNSSQSPTKAAESAIAATIDASTKETAGAIQMATNAPAHEKAKEGKEAVLVPPKLIKIPPAPKGTKYRMVTIQLIGTQDTSWVPEGYMMAPVVGSTNGEPDTTPYALFGGCPTLEGTSFTPPPTTEEIYVHSDINDVHQYWTKHPGQKSGLPFPPK